MLQKLKVIEIFEMSKKNAENFSTKALAIKKYCLQIDDMHWLYERL